MIPKLVMFRLRFPLCVAIAMVVTASRALAMNVVTLHEEAYVKGPQVALGDVADIQGDDADVLAALEVVPAASPGKVKRIHASLLRSRLVTSGYEAEEFEITGAASVNATTLCIELSEEMLEDDLRRFVISEMPWDAANATVDIEAPSSGLKLPEGKLTLEWRPTPLYKYLGRGTIRGEAVVDGEVCDVIYCKVDMEAYSDVVVAAKDISRGSIVSENDIVLEKRALSTMRNGYYEEPQEVIGMVAKSTIFPDTVLNSRHVMPRRIIKRNQIVTVEVRIGTLLVRDRAVAMSNAAAADMIICRRMNSKEEFQGVVRKDGVVVVE
ncbi:MAG: flagellar basal body P-ring formation chaperone FlgA [Candidatus Hydrogenedentota bacterium]